MPLTLVNKEVQVEFVVDDDFLSVRLSKGSVTLVLPVQSLVKLMASLAEDEADGPWPKHVMPLPACVITWDPTAFWVQADGTVRAQNNVRQQDEVTLTVEAIEKFLDWLAEQAAGPFYL
jgi:hypothetical protein